MAVLLPNGKQAFFDNAGNPLVGGKLYTYQAGTSTPKQTWSDAAGTVPNTNPIILDARGEATIFWLGTYKITLHDAQDNLIWTVDQVIAAPIDQTLRADLLASTGSSIVGFNVGLAGAVNRTLQDKGRDTRSVKDFGAKGDGATDDTAAINLALAAGGKIVFPSSATYKISGRLLMTVANTEVEIEGGVTIAGNPWTYPGSQSPFGSLFLITADNCSIKGAGMGQTLIQVNGGSAANAITFLHCAGGYVGFLTVDGSKATGTGIADDTFQSGVVFINATGSNPNNTFSNGLVEQVEMRNWLQYGTQAYGDLASVTWFDCWSHDNGKTGDALSVGSGMALTRGMRNIRLISCTFEGNKYHGLLGSSAGLASYGILLDGNTFRNNGGYGLSWTEEANFGSIVGVGTDGLTSRNNQIYGNAGGGDRYGTFDNVGILKNLAIDNMVRANTGYGTLVQTNNDATNRTTNVMIKSRITGNPGFGLGVGVNMDISVRWDAQRITGNTGGDVQNAGNSNLISCSLGQGASIASAATVTLPADGDIFILTGATNVQNITASPGRRVTFVLGGSITFQTGGNLVMLANFVGTGNSCITFVCIGASWFKQDSSINA